MIKISISALSKKSIGLFLGPLIFIILIFLPPPNGMNPEARAVMSVTIWIAIWWITEAVPIPVTSLLPIILFPISNALDLQTTTEAYGNPIVFLFLGGFMVALAMEKWNLHKRIAINIVKAIGTNKKRIVLGFMVATAFLSMWISNSATAMMMLPIGVAIILQLSTVSEEDEGFLKGNFGKALLLSIAYSASIGGLATLIGTPTNAILAAIVKQLYDVEISFEQWMLMALPIVILLLLLCWYYLVSLAFPLQNTKNTKGQEELERQAISLGNMSWEEKWVLSVFIFIAFLWITRSFLLDKIFTGLDDSMIAIFGAVLLFVIPDSSGKGFLLGWEISRELPWGLLLLFGGGLAIASGFKDSGLAEWIGIQLNMVEGVELIIILAVLVFVINFLTEITSNVATATMMLPILASLATAIEVHPFGPMVAAGMAASCAFMLPVATPPNAIVFGSGYIKIIDMVKAGIGLNFISIVLISMYVYYVLPVVWDIDLHKLPDFIK